MTKISKRFTENTISILDITRMTVHNGPGLRTLVLFKGCPLRCIWCSTPESQISTPQLSQNSRKCIKCYKCLAVCPQKALKIEDDKIIVDRLVCNNCGECTTVCYAQSLTMKGYRIGVRELADELMRDKAFFNNSGGGVTLSGGEPLNNVDDAFMELLGILKDNKITIGVDTAGYVDAETLMKVIPFVSFFLWDLKVMDPKKHKMYTGVDNELILENLRKLDLTGIPIYIRCPIILGMTDDNENLQSICAFLKGFKNIQEIYLLPMHHLGRARYESIGRRYPLEGFDLIQDQEMFEKKKLVESFGFNCSING